VQLKTYRVGGERAARQAHPLNRVLAFLDPLLAGSAPVLEGDDPLGRSRQVDDDEANAGTKLAGAPFDLGHDTARRRPACRRRSITLRDQVPNGRRCSHPRIRQARRTPIGAACPPDHGDRSPTCATINQVLAGDSHQAERVIEFAMGQQAGIGSDAWTVELQLEAAVEIKAQGIGLASPAGCTICDPDPMRQDVASYGSH